jgi:predicted DNA-binding protein
MRGEQMAKMGRPKKDETKSNFIGIRLSDEYYARLMRYASEHGLTITQVVQKALEKLFQGT